MADLVLCGCRTTPLLSYLKALGTFRHVAGADPAARLWWNREGFACLRSRFDADGVVAYFIDEYEPSPITSPWNGGSGYFPGDNTAAIVELERSDDPRLASFRATIASARTMLGTSPAKPDEKTKPALLERWRGSCPEEALPWLDAAVVLREDGTSMNPLLGTGGNDGRLEFSNNFMQRLLECLPELFGRPSTEASEQRLRRALFGLPAELSTAAVGMFDPGGAGLPNSSSVATEKSMVNPWDYILMLEGTLSFGGGAARRLSMDRATFPFTVSRVSRIGRSLDTDADAKTRGETWLPTWRRPASYPSVARLFAEGRTQDGRNQARSGREVMRAVVDIGVDRGIDGFERVVFMERFGRNYIAVPTGRVDVLVRRFVELTRSVDQWLERVRRIDSAEIRRAVGELERAQADIASAADEKAALERWLLALARLQLAVGRRPASRAVSQPTHVSPLADLPARLVTSLERSVEHRLARALAAVERRAGGASLRTLVEPVELVRGNRYAWTESGRPLVDLRRPEDVLVAYAATRAAHEVGGQAGDASTPAARRARLGDIAAFLAGETDDEKLIRLAYAFSLCRPCDQPSNADREPHSLDRLYAACSLALDPGADRSSSGDRPSVRAVEVIPALAAGNARSAARLATRRLRANRLSPMHALEAIERTPVEARRIAAALAFPLHPANRAALERIVLVPVQPDRDQPTSEGARA